MRNCIEYVLRKDKTEERYSFVTGPFPFEEINYDNVYQSFLEEKRLWNKDTGRMYAHNIISWHKDEKITEEQAFAFGKEFAEKWFAGFQTLVSVHKDREHIHVHLVTNSVSFLDGHKLHNTKKDMERMKQFTNQMCDRYGYSIAEKGKDFYGKELEEGYVQAWSKDKYHLLANEAKDSFVAACALAVLEAKEQSCSKEEFIEMMKIKGWQVNWKVNRKNITFVNADGKKVRDSNLSKTFHMEISKGGLLDEFERQAETRRIRNEFGPDTRTEMFITALRNEERASEQNRDHKITERADREAARKRQSAERQRAAAEAERRAQEERSRNKKKRRSYDIGL